MSHLPNHRGEFVRTGVLVGCQVKKAVDLSETMIFIFRRVHFQIGASFGKRNFTINLINQNATKCMF